MEWLNMQVVVYVVELENSVELVLTFCFWGLWGDMGDSDKSNKKNNKSRTEMESLSLDTSRFSRDFLTRFMGSGSKEAEFEMKKEEDEEEEEIELNLGLSLGGRFGVDKSSKKLMRSSSIAACLPVVRDDDAVAASSSPAAYSSLVRTSSLPVETEEEWRKRKELQTLRRMEAKRRRSEKQRILKAEREGVGGGGGGGGGSGGSLTGEEEKKEIEANLRGGLDREQYLAAAKRFSSSVAPPFGVSSWAAAARQAVLGGGIEVAMAKGIGNVVGGNLGQLLSQGSVESQGGSSSELESKSLQGFFILNTLLVSLVGSSSCGDMSPGSIQSSQKGNEQDAGSSRTKTREGAGRTSLAEMESPSKQADIASRGKETRTNTLEEMPCVFTKGDGPNGRRVEGILYKYGKGEEVRIMCVCHGSFLSPAEFVKHAGGTDVTHPLKHIVVNPNATPFL